MREEVRGSRWIAAATSLVLAGLFVAACGGGSDPEPERPEPVAEEPDRRGDVLIPQRRFVEIRALFDRRRPDMTRCYSAAVGQGEIGRDEGGYVTVGLVISEEGRASDLHIYDSTFDSQFLFDCMFERIRQWNFGPLPRPLEYSYRYRFQAL